MAEPTFGVSQKRSDDVLTTILCPYLVSRALVMCILLGVPLVTVRSASEGTRSAVMRPRGNSYRQIEQSLLAGDAVHYLDIVQHGYSRFLSRGWFPLFPLVWKSGALLTHEFAITGSALSNLFFLVALVLLYKVLPLFGYSQAIAARSVAYLTIFPTSHLFSLPLTESLFLALSLGSFYAALRNRWITAGICGAFASATRLPGILLAPALLLMCCLRRNKGTLNPRSLLAVSLIPTGALAYFIYLHFATGDFFAYQKAQAMVMAGVADGALQSPPTARFHFFLSPLFTYLLHPTVFHDWSFFPLQIATILTAMLSAWILFRRRQWVLAVYLAGSIVLPLSAGLTGSFTRFMMVSFPLTVTLAEFGENGFVDQAIRVIFVAVLALLTLACALKFGLGMA